jgi:hypothetical protein
MSAARRRGQRWLSYTAVSLLFLSQILIQNMSTLVMGVLAPSTAVNVTLAALARLAPASPVRLRRTAHRRLTCREDLLGKASRD